MNKEKMEIVKAQSSVKRNKRRIQKTTKKNQVIYNQHSGGSSC